MDEKQFAEKLGRLRQLDNIALFRWTATTKRFAGSFIPLSEVRLNILTCNEGVVHLSMAAPVLYSINGRQRIGFHDSDVFRVVSGRRARINIIGPDAHEGESITELRNICHTNCTIDSPDPVKHKVMSMGLQPVYPVQHIVLPDMYRLTEHPETIRPIYSKVMLELIGGTREDTPETLRKKFLANINLFGSSTEDGYIINNDWVAGGGMVCVEGSGIHRSSGSLVHQIPLGMLKMYVETQYWNIHLEE